MGCYWNRGEALHGGESREQNPRGEVGVQMQARIRCASRSLRRGQSKIPLIRDPATHITSTILPALRRRAIPQIEYSAGKACGGGRGCESAEQPRPVARILPDLAQDIVAMYDWASILRRRQTVKEKRVAISDKRRIMRIRVSECLCTPFDIAVSIPPCSA